MALINTSSWPNSERGNVLLWDGKCELRATKRGLERPGRQVIFPRLFNFTWACIPSRRRIGWEILGRGHRAGVAEVRHEGLRVHRDHHRGLLMRSFSARARRSEQKMPLRCFVHYRKVDAHLKSVCNCRISVHSQRSLVQHTLLPPSVALCCLLGCGRWLGRGAAGLLREVQREAREELLQRAVHVVREVRGLAEDRRRGLRGEARGRGAVVPVEDLPAGDAQTASTHASTRRRFLRHG